MANSPEEILIEGLKTIATRPAPIRPAPIVEFENATPSGWNVAIVAMGAVFNYKDANEKPIGNEQRQQAGPLYSGQSSYVQGTRHDCCSSVFVAITVKAEDEEAKNFYGNIPDTPKECFLRTRFTLGQQNKIANISERDLLSTLELRVISP